MCAKSSKSYILIKRKITFFFYPLRKPARYVWSRCVQIIIKLIMHSFFVVSLAVGHVAVETFAGFEKFENGR